MAQKDILDGFFAEEIKLADDNEGPSKAVLVYKKAKVPSTKAVLYIHGFADYFFQTHLAEEFLSRGYNFFALDLHKYGRSLMGHQTPNFCLSLSEYYEEIDRVVEVICDREKNSSLVVHAHSTGGLISSLYAHEGENRRRINALVLNSPWFDMNIRWDEKYITLPASCFLGRFFPYLVLPKSLNPNYTCSIHKDFFVERKKELGVYEEGCWDFSLEWKPTKGFPITAGFMRAIKMGQLKLHKGLAIECPVLVCRSDKKGKSSKKLKDYYFHADGVLDPAHIKQWAPKLCAKSGAEVTDVCIPGGLHDLALSPSPVRQEYFEKIFSWLS